MSLKFKEGDRGLSNGNVVRGKFIARSKCFLVRSQCLRHLAKRFSMGNSVLISLSL